MTQSQFSLTWESFKSNICNGFSSLQQNAEFVDMTIAADGHLVKVHQVLMALSSPYIKELITSAPCQHPVIFLNNVSHATLVLILEYIYTGEVRVPARNLSSFIETAKALHIKGLEGMDSDTGEISILGESYARGVKRKSEANDEFSLPSSARKISIKREGSSISQNTRSLLRASKNENENDNIQSYSILEDSNDMHDSDDILPMQTSDFAPTNIIGDVKTSKDKSTANLQFTVSIRGSLQIILNRYIYNLQSTAASGVRRWRCADYRSKKCNAFVVTNGNIVMNRANPHNHSFHDKKILAKIEKNAVYSAIDDMDPSTYKEKQTEDSAEVSVDNDYTTLGLPDLTDKDT
ncbi:protein abrupt-like [Aricia agestis]|uniref:protein abrupt-like n=1 Tax=Aricia agestis TaxID=91739 RepID=UPI001C208996|nr:protein abrupt-like [Aricia agestis]